ncbi:hypothetical protein B0H19DRAFT_1233316 [Mycena capillaripes]|nr:hypothetical protein B0H19DRAFT_1233316 [Mycena capillaripes]
MDTFIARVNWLWNTTIAAFEDLVIWNRKALPIDVAWLLRTDEHTIVNLTCRRVSCSSLRGIWRSSQNLGIGGGYTDPLRIRDMIFLSRIYCFHMKVERRGIVFSDLPEHESLLQSLPALRRGLLWSHAHGDPERIFKIRSDCFLQVALQGDKENRREKYGGKGENEDDVGFALAIHSPPRRSSARRGNLKSTQTPDESWRESYGVGQETATGMMDDAGLKSGASPTREPCQGSRLRNRDDPRGKCKSGMCQMRMNGVVDPAGRCGMDPENAGGQLGDAPGPRCDLLKPHTDVPQFDHDGHNLAANSRMGIPELLPAHFVRRALAPASAPLGRGREQGDTAVMQQTPEDLPNVCGLEQEERRMPLKAPRVRSGCPVGGGGDSHVYPPVACALCVVGRYFGCPNLKYAKAPLKEGDSEACPVEKNHSCTRCDHGRANR